MVNLRIAQRRFADASAELEGMRDLAPDNAPANGLAALIAMQTGDAHQAWCACTRAYASSHPTHPMPTVLLAAAQGMSGDLAAADATLADAPSRASAQPSSRLTRWASSRPVAAVPDQTFLRIWAMRCVRRDPNVMMLAAEPELRGAARRSALGACC